MLSTPNISKLSIRHTRFIPPAEQVAHTRTPAMSAHPRPRPYGYSRHAP